MNRQWDGSGLPLHLPQALPGNAPGEPVIPTNAPVQRAKRLLTRRSLVAFDLDKTVLHQGEKRELQTFTTSVCQTLIQLTLQRHNIAAVTGNDLHQLSCRFVRTLVEELCRQRKLELLSLVHLFCNCAAVYICFPAEHNSIAALVAQQSLETEKLLEAAYATLFHEVNGLLEVHPAFIVPEYLSRTCMPAAEAETIAQLAQAAAAEWWLTMCTDAGSVLRPELAHDFFINSADPAQNEQLQAEAARSEDNPEASVYPAFRRVDGALALCGPYVQARDVNAANGATYSAALTIKPVLSFRHARRAMHSCNDGRSELISAVQSSLLSAGLAQYVATAGGRSSVDVMKQGITKKYALSFLIEVLGVSGIAAEGEEVGTNVIYFGDEVVMHGNDLCVADIPGILVFAVNHRRDRVPLNAQIMIPSVQLQGPEATDAILRQLHQLTADLLAQYEEWMRAGTPGLPRPAHVTAIRAFKEQLLSKRVISKAQQLVANVDATCPSKLFVASTMLSALARPGRESAELARQVQQLVDMAGEISLRVKESEFDVGAMGAVGGSYFEQIEPPS